MMFVLILLVGAAGGFAATKLFNMEDNMPIAIGVGVGGAFLGYVILRALASLLATKTFALIIGGVLGALAAVYIYKTYFGDKG